MGGGGGGGAEVGGRVSFFFILHSFIRDSYLLHTLKVPG